jgi:hypothetical protein
MNNLKKNLDLLAVFFISFAAFFITQFSIKYLAGNDSFLYAGLAEITGQRGFLKEFPWLNATIMRENFTGLHFLFYSLLTPLTYLVGLFLAAKIGISLFFAAMNTVFYFLLKQFNLKYPFLWWLLFLAASPMFLYRMSFIKPFSLSVALILLAFYAIVKNKNLLLLVVSFLAVWTHPSFILIPAIAFLYLVIRIIPLSEVPPLTKGVRGIFRDGFLIFQSLLYSLLGIILGLIINPFFPNNLNLLNAYSGGPSFYSIAEWQPIAMTKIIGDAPILIILFAFFACCYFVIPLLKNNLALIIKKENTPILLSFSIAFIMLVSTTMCNRFIDYYIPFMVLFVALAGEHCLKNYCYRWFHSARPASGPMEPECESALRFHSPNGTMEPTKTAFTIFLSVIILLTAASINNLRFVSQRANNGAAETEKIKNAAEWLKENTPANSIIFNANWGDFPKLFFYNTRNYYVAGLDPKFIYQHSPQKYWLYEHIIKGEVCTQKTCPVPESSDKMYNIIKYQFNADYIFISDISEYSELVNVLEPDERFERVYEENEIEIWELIPSL